jgi:uncharacterized protein YndB with AHSA1/START domain
MRSDRSEQRIIGTLREENGFGVVRMEDRFRTDAEDLWSAVTDPERLARWIAEVRGELQPGGGFEAKFTSGWEGNGRVDVCEPPHHLLVTLSPGTDDQTLIEAWIGREGDHAVLVVEERGLPLEEYAMHGAGWQAHFEDLGAHLAGRQPSNWRVRWRELIPNYTTPGRT